MFTIEYVEGVADDLAGIRPFDRRQLVDRIEEQLRHEPTTPSQNKKMPVGLIPPWDHMPPVLQLRVGDLPRLLRRRRLGTTCNCACGATQAAPHHHGGYPVKTVVLEQSTLDACVREAQQDRVIITRNGVPIAIVVGVEGLDAEQVQLGIDDAFWGLIAERRQQKALSREELERKCDEAN